ncbi:tripartite tricarboxylate transporter TctB family protein [Desulfosporosinus sp. FKA]|uniref:tripartite tricarboxylate transporter TctB family protein n=1 Tax=Desulfosporosinus sp. FKA TaxID=1969834 RepID=UPI0015567E5A|nr:tripartite tricarboxylate transporter TctB family protein [Desulfosporosinus sp. FKA]
MEKHQTGNLIDSIATILLGFIIWFMIPYQIVIPSSLAQVAVNPQLIPRILAVVLILAGVFHLLSCFRHKERSIVNEGKQEDGAIIRLLLGMIAIFAYVALMPILGFVLATILDILCFIYLLGQPKWYISLPVAVIASVIIWVIFYQLLNVPLPTGFLGFI